MNNYYCEKLGPLIGFLIIHKTIWWFGIIPFERDLGKSAFTQLRETSGGSYPRTGLEAEDQVSLVQLAPNVGLERASLSEAVIISGLLIR